MAAHCKKRAREARLNIVRQGARNPSLVETFNRMMRDYELASLRMGQRVEWRRNVTGVGGRLRAAAERMRQP